MKSVLSESDKSGFTLRRLIVVASECPGRITSELQEIQEGEPRLCTLVEGKRRGKADATNKILSASRGTFVVMVNADAVPEPGSIQMLLSIAESDDRVGAVSAMPVVEPSRGLSSAVVGLLWDTHNANYSLLNHLGLSNHASEELVVFRRSAIGLLPRGLVNDGAFLASVVRRRGYTVRFSESAKVHIETPERIPGLIAQRRRILYGHAQVWRKVGSPPKTIESLLLFSPSLGFRILVRVMARRPRSLVILPLLVVTEVFAALLSIFDSLGSTGKHSVWRRVT